MKVLIVNPSSVHTLLTDAAARTRLPKRLTSIRAVLMSDASAPSLRRHRAQEALFLTAAGKRDPLPRRSPRPGLAAPRTTGAQEGSPANVPTAISASAS